ncbi:Short-chain dehydrogenase/reductase SDR [Penicillium occitanis (nom. inval.)]|nr:hypothetical protein PENOC_042990 [Penicillium occitanis (nom. inval.)]PCH02958.1 Short-chain dehydrogenase/reductase SDR [Penicillium occitanis (nom. inval.)]
MAVIAFKMVLHKPEKVTVQKLFNLTGKVVAVTAVATAYAEVGAEVTILYRTTPTAPETAAAFTSKFGKQCRAYKADITVPAQISAAINQVVNDFGKLDVVVANAGICSEHAGEDCGKVFKCQGFGNVVFTASISATLVNTPQRQAAYNASKAGVLQLAKSLVVEWVDFCRVNCVSPGYIQTQTMEYVSQEMLDKWRNQIQTRRFASPYKLKGVYLFCTSDASSYMTGSNIGVDGEFALHWSPAVKINKKR